MKRLKHKENNKLPTVILCSRCGVVDVTKDDGEMECVCASCWVILNEENRRNRRIK